MGPPCDRSSTVLPSLVAALALAIALSTPAPAQEQVRVRYALSLPTLSLIVSNQTSIPKHLGYYAEEGLNVEVSTSSGTACTQLVASGQQDICSGTQSATIARAVQGQDLGLVFFYNQIRDFHYVVGVLPDSPITDIKHLKGKRIGVTVLGSEAVLATRYFARDAGLSPDSDLEFVATGIGAQALHALKTGRVDALANLPGFFTQMEILGQELRYLAVPEATKLVFGPGLAARRDYLAKNRRTLVGVGRAVAKSSLFMITNPEAAVRIHWTVFPEQKPQGVPDATAIRDAVKVVNTQIDGLRLSDDLTPKLWGIYTPESWAAYLKVYDLTDKVPDPTRFYTNDLIRDINDFDQQKVIDQAKSFKLR